MLLSIAMIVKNEEKNIDRCLKALKQLDNKVSYEIVVVDTGSTDKTIEIAKKYTDRVYEHKWNNNFGDMRNKSIKYCRGKWILILDADEVLENPDSVVKFFDEEECDRCNCAVIQFKNMLSKNEDNFLLGSLIRMFKNKKEFCYEGRVHEQPKLFAPIGYTNITLRHYGYSRASYELMEYKYKRNLKLLLRDIEEGNDSAYTYFQLAQTYAMANKHNKALEAIKNAYRLGKADDMSKYIYVLHFYARDMLGRGNFDKAIELCQEALKYSDEHLDFYYILLKSYKAHKDTKKEKEYINKYFDLYYKLKGGYIVQDISVNCFSYSEYHNILQEDVLNAYDRKDYEDIISAYNRIEREKDKKKFIEVYMYALMKLGKAAEIKKILHSKDEIKDLDVTNVLNILNRTCIEAVEKSSDIAEQLIGIDKRIDIYIKTKYFEETINCEHDIDFNKYTEWKAEIAEKLYSEDSNFINDFIGMSSDDVKAYVIHLVQNYKCLESLCKYSKDKFMTADLDELILLVNIEEVLLVNNSIEKDEYNNLVERAIINKMMYIKSFYNLAIINENNGESVLSAHDYVIFEVYSAVNVYNEDKLKYIKMLKTALHKAPEYNTMIEYFLAKMDKNSVNDDMKKEKQNLLNVVEQSIAQNKIGEAIEILDELMKLFKFDHDILSYRGVVDYINTDYNEALVKLGMADLLLNDNFDIIYNIACVMEAVGRKQDAAAYYSKAYELCSDENMKNDINTVINGLKEA